MQDPQQSSGQLHSTAPFYKLRSFWLTMAVCAVVYLPSLVWTLGLDQNIFAEIGSLMLRGAKPYVDAWDVKPPNVFYVYAAAQWLFGEREIAVRLVDFVAAMAACAAMYVAVKRRSGRLGLLGLNGQEWTASLAAVLLCLTLFSLGLADTAQTESFALCFVLIAPYLALDRRRSFRLLAGVAIAIATFFKTTNAVFLLPILIELWLVRISRRDRIQTSLMILGGFILWCGVQLGLLALQGNLQEYLSITSHVMRAHPQEASSLRAFDLLRALWVGVDIWTIIALIAIGWSLYRSETALIKTLRLPLLYLFAGLLAVYIQNKGWGYHYVISHPGLISTCAISAVYLYAEKRRYSVKGSWVALTLIALATLFITPSARRRWHQYANSALSITDHYSYIATLGAHHSLYYPECTVELAQFIRVHTTPTDNLFIFGEEPGVYWRTHRMPASKFIYSLLFTSGVIPPQELQAIGDSVRAKKPALIIIERFDTLAFRGKPETSESIVASDPNFESLRRVMHEQYGVVDTVCWKFIVYHK